MNPAPASGPPETIAATTANSAHTRRRRAAWLDYLRATGEAPETTYGTVETNAWEQLQRRLRRNDELLALALNDAAWH